MKTGKDTIMWPYRLFSPKMDFIQESGITYLNQEAIELRQIPVNVHQALPFLINKVCCIFPIKKKYIS